MERNRTNACLGFRKGRTPRRGIAMMLVVVAIAVGTVVAAATLTSNGNASVIGRNTVEASSARWSGHAASEMIVAAMQTETAWESILAGDTLIENWAVGGSTVDVRVTDMDGNPATADDREILVHITTAAGVTTERIIKQVSRSTETIFGDEIDPELGEFALYVQRDLDIDDESRVGVWGMSPDAELRPEVKIGMATDSSGDYKVDVDASLKSAELYVLENASAALKGEIEGAQYQGGRVLPDVIPVIQNYLPGQSLKLPFLGFSANYSSGTNLFPESGNYLSSSITSKATLVIDGSVSPMVSFGSLSLSNGGTIRIRGDVELIVFGWLSVRSQGRIELEEGATLRMYVGASVSIDSGFVGVPTNDGGDPIRAIDDFETYCAAGDARFHDLAELFGGDSNPTWTVENGSIVHGSIHAGNTRLRLDTGSTLIGRATCEDLRVTDSAILYDPAFDNRTGFTDPMSPIWDNGAVRAEYAPAMGLLGLASQPIVDLSEAERQLVLGYTTAEDRSAYLRRFTSEILGESYISADDPVLSIFDDLATAMSEEKNMTAIEIEAALGTMLSGIDPGHAVDVGAVRIAGETIDSLLNPGEGTIKGGLGGDTDSPPVIATTETPKVDVAQPDADGNFTLRRESKARARTVNGLAGLFEGRR